MSRHMGVRRTLTKIYNRFVWDRLVIDVTNYVQSCPNCQCRKDVNKRQAGFLQCIQVARPFEKVGIDLLERMNHSLASLLSMYVSADHKDWDEALLYVCFAYNTARPESTGY